MARKRIEFFVPSGSCLKLKGDYYRGPVIFEIWPRQVEAYKRRVCKCPAPPVRGEVAPRGV